MDPQSRPNQTSASVEDAGDYLAENESASAEVPLVNTGFSRRVLEGSSECADAARAGNYPKIVQSLRNTDFRLFWAGNCLSNIGTWMQNVAQGWLVLQLTNSSFWLGFIGFAASLPFLLFTLFGGVIADRVNKRRLLLVTQSAMMVLAFIMAALTHWKIITVAQISVLAFLNGVAMALNAPSYQATVPQLVPREDLTNAIALNSAQFHLSRILGPTLGGYAMAWVGIAGNFFINGLSFLAVIFAIARIRYRAPRKVEQVSVWDSLRDGLRYVHAEKKMWALVVLALALSLLVMPFVTFVPFFAKNTLHVGERGLGFLMACSGAGAFLSAVHIAWRRRLRRRGHRVVFFGIAGMMAMIGFCYSTHFAFSALLMFLEGVCFLQMIAPVNVAMQELSSDEMRGRVMSINTLAFLGMPPIGNLIAGELSRHMPAAHALAGMLATSAIFYLVYYLRTPALRELD